MVFSSMVFLLRFLPLVLLVYGICPKPARNAVLFLASLIFYAWGEPVYVLLMLFSTAVDYIHGRLVEQYRNEGRARAARLAVISSVVVNLLLLGFFKYADFLIEVWNHITGQKIQLLSLPLPIGISFYTFQTMSYTIDIYRGQAESQKSMLDFGTYVALFPQLIAGPIVRYQTIAGELAARRFDYEDFGAGALRFVTGLGKKVLLANPAGSLYEQIAGFGAAGLPVVTAWMGILAFAFQIYFDFSGYSDMAIGLGRMFGFHFPENFRYPYESGSITEFWRRWHISLGTWFREYLYIPLGGSRKGEAKQVRNILLVWLLTGLWHGAAWNFVLWGLYFGVLLLLEKFVFQKGFGRLPSAVRRLLTFFLILIGWVLFGFPDLTEGMAYLGAMFGAGGLIWNTETWYLLSGWWLLFLIWGIGCTHVPKQWGERLAGKRAILPVLFLIVVFLLSLAYLVDATYNPFLYFRF